MNKYKVFGSATVSVTREVWACSEEEAIEKSAMTEKNIVRSTPRCTVEIIDDVRYDDAVFIEEDPDHFDCPFCNSMTTKKFDPSGDVYFRCQPCKKNFDADGVEIVFKTVRLFS